MKKIIYLFITTFLFSITNLVYGTGSTVIKDLLITTTNSDISNISKDDGLDLLSSLFVWFKSEIMSIVGIFVIGVFIFIGFKFVMARGNPEEFKKAWTYFIYAVVGVFFIFMAWGLVKLVSSLRL